MPVPEVNISLNGCLGICDWNSGMILMGGSEKISDFIKKTLKSGYITVTDELHVHLDKQRLFPKLLVLDLDVTQGRGAKILQLISQFIESFPKSWFEHLKSAHLVLNDDDQVFLGLANNPGGSQLIEFKEMIVINNGSIQEGNGEITLSSGIFNVFKLNETIIQRPKSQHLLWNPVIMSYLITSWSQSMRLTTNGVTISLSVDCPGLQSANILIECDAQPAEITLNPNNLAHSARIKSPNLVYWRIEAVSPGSTYSLTLHSAKILHVEMSARIEGTLLSDFQVKTLQIDGTAIDTKSLARVSYATEVKETLAM